MCKITSSWEPAGIDRELSSVLRNDLEVWGGRRGKFKGIYTDIPLIHIIVQEKRLLLGRKAMTHPASILKSRDITLPTKVPLVKSMVFPVSCMDVRVGP